MDNWSEHFPKKEGIYWFYGWPYSKDGDPRLCCVFVYKIMNGFAHVADGRFIYEREAEGWWQEADVPELPEIE